MSLQELQKHLEAGLGRHLDQRCTGDVMKSVDAVQTEMTGKLTCNSCHFSNLDILILNLEHKLSVLLLNYGFIHKYMPPKSIWIFEVEYQN